MTKDQAEMIEILLKNTINLHEKINMILDAFELERVDLTKHSEKTDNELIKIDRTTYEQMCDLMDSNVIPFMGIA